MSINRVSTFGLIACTAIVSLSLYASYCAANTSSVKADDSSENFGRDEFLISEIFLIAPTLDGRDVGVYGYVALVKDRAGDETVWMVPFPELVTSDVGDSISQLALAMEFDSDNTKASVAACKGKFGVVYGTIEVQGRKVSILISNPDDGVVVYEGSKFRTCN